jgi:hypothetical protein
LSDCFAQVNLKRFDREIAGAGSLVMLYGIQSAAEDIDELGSSKRLFRHGPNSG